MISYQQQAITVGAEVSRLDGFSATVVNGPNDYGYYTILTHATGLTKLVHGGSLVLSDDPQLHA